MNICQEGAWVWPPWGTERWLGASQPGPTCAGAGGDPCTGAGHGRAGPSWGPVLGRAPSSWPKTGPSWRKQPRYLPISPLTEPGPNVFHLPFFTSSTPCSSRLFPWKCHMLMVPPLTHCGASGQEALGISFAVIQPSWGGIKTGRVFWALFPY